VTWVGAGRARAPILSFQNSGDLVVCFITRTQLPSYGVITVQPSNDFWLTAGSIACHLYFNSTQGVLQEYPICDSTVSTDFPFTLTVALCMLRTCIPKDTTLRLHCVTNLLDNGPPGPRTFSIWTSADTQPLVNQTGYDVQEDTTPSSVVWRGATRQESYITNADPGALNVRFVPTRYLSSSDVIYVTTARPLWKYDGAVDCSLLAHGRTFETNSTASLAAPYTLTVRLLPMNETSSKQDIHTEVQLLCVGDNLSRNSEVPTSITFGIHTSKDAKRLENQHGYKIIAPPPPPPPLAPNFETPITTGVLNQGECGACYAFASVAMITTRLNLWGLPGLGRSSFPQEGCGSCTNQMGCTAWCKQKKSSLFGWCKDNTTDSPLQCCACSSPGLGDRVLSPGHMVQCNRNALQWTSKEDAVLHTLARAWLADDMGGCDGGFPLLAIAYMKNRGVGTCDQKTSCATGCVPYEFVPEDSSGAQSSAPMPVIWEDPNKCTNVQEGAQEGGPIRRVVGKGKTKINGCTGSAGSASTCPFRCLKLDRDGKCLEFNRGLCRDNGKAIYHYHSLQPVPILIPGLPWGSTDTFHLPNATMAAIMYEIQQHGPIVASMEIFQGPLSIYTELENTMRTGSIYLARALSALSHGLHAVLIVGWGIYEGVLYWKVQNSWGKSLVTKTLSGDGPISSMVMHEVPFPEDGFFRIRRGSNFCGIESQLVYASAVKDLHEEQLLPAALTNATMTRARSSGGWVELPEFGGHLGVTHAAQHMVQQHQGTVVPAEFHEHTVTSVKAQVVAGANYKITMTAKHVTTGDLHKIDGVVHRDRSGHHSMKYLGLPRKEIVAQDITQSMDSMPTPVAPAPATDPAPAVQGAAGTVDSGTASKASTAAAGIQVVPQANTESSDKVHVPTWALWLTGAAFTMLIAVIIGLIYDRSTKRRRPASGTMVELEKVGNPRSRAPSLEGIDVMDEEPAPSKVGSEDSVVASPRAPSKTTCVRARSVSQEGVICLD